MSASTGSPTLERTGTDEDLEQLIAFLADHEDSPACEIQHTTSMCQEKAISRRRFKCKPHGYNMCKTADTLTRFAIENSQTKCRTCKQVIGDCWFIISI